LIGAGLRLQPITGQAAKHCFELSSPKYFRMAVVDIVFQSAGGRLIRSKRKKKS
jgi:hypothetical protein